MSNFSNRSSSFMRSTIRNKDGTYETRTSRNQPVYWDDKIQNNFYDDPKLKDVNEGFGNSTRSIGSAGDRIFRVFEQPIKTIDGYSVSETLYNKAQDYNAFRDIADAGMVAMATNNALLSNKKAKKSLFQQQDNSIFGNI